jgi:hypothetical protein
MCRLKKINVASQPGHDLVIITKLKDSKWVGDSSN